MHCVMAGFAYLLYPICHKLRRKPKKICFCHHFNIIDFLIGQTFKQLKSRTEKSSSAVPTWGGGGGVSASILFMGEGRVIRGGAQKKKSPDFGSSEVGISVNTTGQQ